MFDSKTEYSTSTQHTKILQPKIQNLKNRGDTTGRVNVEFKIWKDFPYTTPHGLPENTIKKFYLFF